MICDAYYMLHATRCMLRVTLYMFHVTCYMLHVTCYMLHVTSWNTLHDGCYMLHATVHVFTNIDIYKVLYCVQHIWHRSVFF